MTIVPEGGVKRSDTVLERCSLFHMAVSLGRVSEPDSTSSIANAAVPLEVWLIGFCRRSYTSVRWYRIDRKNLPIIK